MFRLADVPWIVAAYRFAHWSCTMHVISTVSTCDIDFRKSRSFSSTCDLLLQAFSPQAASLACIRTLATEAMAHTVDLSKFGLIGDKPRAEISDGEPILTHSCQTGFLEFAWLEQGHNWGLSHAKCLLQKPMRHPRFEALQKRAHASLPIPCLRIFNAYIQGTTLWGHSCLASFILLSCFAKTHSRRNWLGCFEANSPSCLIFLICCASLICTAASSTRFSALRYTSSTVTRSILSYRDSACFYFWYLLCHRR